MITVDIDMVKIGEDDRIGLKMPYHKELIAVIKEIPGARWDSSLRLWHTAVDEDILKLITSKLKPFTQVDLKALRQKMKLKKVNQADKKYDFLKEPTQDALKEFERWMCQQRYSPMTVKNYTSQLIQFFRATSDKPFDKITAADVEKYNFEMIIGNNQSVSFQRGLIGAIKLFYHRLNNSSIDLNRLQHPFKEQRLPEVLSKEEIKNVLLATQNIKHKAMLSLIYACGLRRSELLDMKIRDLDSARKIIHIKMAKGKKDRIVPFSSRLRDLLAEYYKQFHPRDYLFEGQYGGRYGERSIEKILADAVHKCNILKRVTLHTLRHSYATHQLESGTDIRYIQALLGHNSLKTTMIYTHISSNKLENLPSPFDDLGL